MKREQQALEILKGVGGKENIKGLTHCVTRLRFTLNNEEKANRELLEKIEGVLGVSKSGGQFQIIIGPTVKEVYEEISKFITVGKSVIEEKKPFSIKNLAKDALDTLISCFTPAIPVIAGSGMIKVLIVLLSQVGWLAPDSSTYQVLYMIGDTVFYFLPFFVAYNAAKKMDVDVFSSIVLAGILMHPTLLTLEEPGNYIGFIGFSLQIVNYSAQALPVIFAVWLLKYVDRFANKVSPNLVKVFLRPMISLLIVAPVMLIVIGPASSVLGGWFAAMSKIMMEWGWIAVGINAALFPIMVLTGTHNATIPFIVQLFITQGFDSIFLPSGMAANMAEAGAAGAVALKTKNKELRGTALSASFSSLLGITEPALYGVNLRLKKPFLGVLLGSLLGGCYVGMVGLTAPTFVTPMILTAPIYVGAGVNMLLGLSCVPVCYFITFIISYLIGFQDIENEEETKKIKSPVSGQLIELAEVNDQAFSSKAMGEGFAVIPNEGRVVSPFNGEVISLFPTHHAIGLKNKSGVEMLIHIGIDTVNLNGEHFKALAKQGDFIKDGQTLIEFDTEKIVAKGFDLTTIVVITNTDLYQKIELKEKGMVSFKQEVLHVE